MVAAQLSRGGALVTGAAKRIGRRLALEAASAGYAVAVHHRSSRAEAEELVEEIRAGGGTAAAVAADLASEEQTQALVDAAAEAVGPLSLLVNNASVFEDDRIGSLTRESWDRHLVPNLRAPILLAQRFAAQAPAGADALIVNLLDQRVLKPDPRFFSYGLSKAGLWWATRTLAQALAPHVRVNGIGPGPTLQSVHQSENDFANEAASTLTGRGATPDEIARALRYLIDAPSVTGQMIAVDGGQHLLWRTPDIREP